MSDTTGMAARWPALDYDTIAPTLAYVHRLAQIGGKYTLDQIYERCYGNIVLPITARGFSTPLLHCDDVSFTVDYALLDDRVNVTASTGTASLPLASESVADFYAAFVAAVKPLGIVPLRTETETELPDARPFAADRDVRTYDPAAAKLIWRALASASDALKVYQAPFRGARPPVGIMWGGFDLSATRYNGKSVAPPPERPVFMRNGMNSEEVAIGFAFGDDNTKTPAFYAYVVPATSAMATVDFGVPGAAWIPQAGLASLPWEAVRTSPDPQAAVVRFADAVYDVVVKHAGWDAGMLGPRETGWYASNTPIP